ncbi:unnamed protein product [Chilo suppressalis]|uniref:Arrestin C-terminal-like domain-containing protein n=1 Tax=Chilo suppressalis TaxID=168631 RepID=A0ABN8AX29_CHISP|nr:unnamed protein product [Chilo suppressalis]
MGIFCKIGVVEDKNELTPGSVVSGAIKYAFDKDTVVKRIVISLKGRGHLCITNHSETGSSQSSSSDTMSELYVSIENVILNDISGEHLENGEYDTPFNFLLPENIPGSLKYEETGLSTDIECKIAYFIRIKFEVIGFLKFNKKFEKEINIAHVLKPRLSMEPVTYGARNQFFQPFKIKKSFVNVKACIKCSVLEPGGKVEIAYEVLNDSNKIVEAIETKLVTVYKFYYHHDEKNYFKPEPEEVKNTESKTSAIKSGETLESSFEIEIPFDLHCIGDNKLVSRDYAVAIIAHLPMPHINVRLEIPIQVGKTSVVHPVSNIDGSPVEYDSPPSYWEAMNVANEKGVSSDNRFFGDAKK